MAVMATPKVDEHTREMARGLLREADLCDKQARKPGTAPEMIGYWLEEARKLRAAAHAALNPPQEEKPS